MPVKFTRKSVPALTQVGRHNPLSKRYKRIYDLGDERKAILDSMFSEARPVPEIINVLQNEWGVFTDVKVGTLTKFLYRYKWDVIDKGLVIRQGMLKDKISNQILANASDQFDVLQEVIELITVQKSRVGKLLAREKDMPMLFNSLGGEMKTLAGFLNQYSDLSFELGILRRVPKLTKITKDGESTLVESDGKDHITFNMDNPSKIESAAKAFFQVLDQGIEDVESE